MVLGIVFHPFLCGASPGHQSANDFFVAQHIHLLAPGAACRRPAGCVCIQYYCGCQQILWNNWNPRILADIPYEVYGKAKPHGKNPWQWYNLIMANESQIILNINMLQNSSFIHSKHYFLFYQVVMNAMAGFGLYLISKWNDRAYWSMVRLLLEISYWRPCDFNWNNTLKSM